MKVKYSELMQSEIAKVPPLADKIKITYRLFPKTKRLVDVSNVCSVVDKFFCDALVQSGCIPDDNYKYLPKVEYEFGEVDKNNPRVEIEIQELI